MTTTFYFDSTGSTVIAIADRGRVSLVTDRPVRPVADKTDTDVDLFAILDSAD